MTVWVNLHSAYFRVFRFADLDASNPEAAAKSPLSLVTAGSFPSHVPTMERGG